MQILQNFLHNKASKERLGDVSALDGCVENSGAKGKIFNYGEDRNRVDLDATSRLRFVENLNELHTCLNYVLVRIWHRASYRLVNASERS